MKATRVRGGERSEDSTLMSLMEATCAALLTVHPPPLQPILSSMVRDVRYRLNVSSWVNGEDKEKKIASGRQNERVNELMTNGIKDAVILPESIIVHRGCKLRHRGAYFCLRLDKAQSKT